MKISPETKIHHPRLPDPLPDFSNREKYPGLTGNPFDILLHGLERLEKWPALLFLAALTLLSLLTTYPRLVNSAVVLAFMLLDWLVLSTLPKRGKSFGPARPPTLLLAIGRALIGFLPLPFAIPLHVLATMVVYHATWIEPHRIHITLQSLETPKLPPGLGLRVLHLGDLHLEHPTRREAQLQAEIEDLKPDLILFSGDFLNLSYLRDPQSHRELIDLLQTWKAPLGVFAVTGSPAVDLPDVIPHILTGTGLQFLENRKVILQKDGCEFDLVGISCSHQPHQDNQVLTSLVLDSPKSFTLLLYHSPDLAPWAAQRGLDLQLSGHTHGGQIRMPFLGAIITGSLFGRIFQAGRYQIDQLTLYITRGIGMEGAGAPRARFLCPPEIILWEINP